jgi:hypothetical protein
MFKKFIIGLFFTTIIACTSSNTDDSNLVNTIDFVVGELKGENVRKHMEVLASDKMLGREAGTENYDKAAQYLIQNFSDLGLKPLGNGGSFEQPIRFIESRLDTESTVMRIYNDDRAIDFIFKDDYIRSGGFGNVSEKITAPLVFVGYGIIAPEYNHDDYKGINVKDKILVVLSGAPPNFKTDQRAFYSSGRTKAEIAIAQGASGIISLRTPVDQKRRPWERYLPGVGSPGMRWLNQYNEPYNGYTQLQGSATISQAGAKKLFELSGHDLDQIFNHHAEGLNNSFDMGVTATLERSSNQREVLSSNIIGFIEGSDPILRSQYVIYTAHLDHIGIRTGKGNDHIHNGAYDNAAGIGSIIEIASSILSMDQPPRRSIIFAALTAEEKGLQGSSYFVKNPTVPIESLVANINIDMPYLGFPVADIHAFGAEHSSLYGAMETATQYIGIQFTPDPLPEEVRFVRSDQFSFVKEGIPALALKAGTISSDPNIDGGKELDNFLKNHYHQPTDDLNLPFSNEGTERFARTGLLLGLIVANDEQKPTWNADDFFGDKFAPK